MTPVHAEAGKNIKNAVEQKSSKGVDNMTDWYEITERIKKFNDMLNELGGSL